MPRSPISFARKLRAFCQKRAAALLSPRDTEALETYLLAHLENGEPFPTRSRGYDWGMIASRAVIAADVFSPAVTKALGPGLDAVSREIDGHGSSRRGKRQRRSSVVVTAAPGSPPRRVARISSAP